MTHLSLFEELVASEAAIRADYIYRNKRISFNDGSGAVFYDASNPDRGNNRVEVAAQLYENFIRTYNYMFMDSRQHEQLVEDKICNTRDLKADQAQQMYNIFKEFTDQYYDENGNARLTEQEVPQALAGVYKRITDEIPLNHAGMALGSLFVELGRGDKWKNITPRGIDFTRGEKAADIRSRIENAINGQNHSPETSGFIQHPEMVEMIAGVPFPYIKVEGWRKHLVTDTGHLVDLTDDLRASLEAHINAGKPIDDFKLNVHEGSFHLWQFQQSQSETTREGKEVCELIRKKLEGMAEADVIDGVKVKGADGLHVPVSLVSMDVDQMTGLRMRSPKDNSELKTFKSFIAKHGYAELSDLLPKDFNTNITRLTDGEKEAARDKLRTAIGHNIADLKDKAAGDDRLVALIERAGARLSQSLVHVYEATDKAFIDETSGKEKQPPAAGQKPQMYLSMGGTASGKSGLKRLAKNECGNDLVIASLDDARGEADRYWFYPATNNHNDDYKGVEEFAKVHRDLTTRRAFAGHYNLFIDGSGIPYEGRNDKTTKQFKDEGYSVSVLAAQAPLYINNTEMREQLSAEGKTFDDSSFRLGKRLAKELRVVPMEIVAEKHIGFSIASRNAARDKNVDRFMIQDVSGPQGTDSTLSYVLTLGRDDMKKIASLQDGALKKALVENNLVPDWVKLPEGEGSEKNFDAKVIRDNSDGTYRVEVITDIRQYVNMVQKGLLRRDAKGPEAWFDNTLRSDIEGHFKGEDGKLQLQSPQGVAVSAWVNYQPLSSRLTPTEIPVSGFVRT